MKLPTTITYHEKSRLLAASALQANLTDFWHNGRKYQLLLTGGNQFKCLWARDFSFAVGGALALGLDQAVHDSLDLFFSLQREDGLLPRLIDGSNMGFKTRFALSYLGFTPGLEGPAAPNFISEHGVITVDGNVLLPWAASLYLKKSKNMDAARLWWPHALRAVAFLETHHLVDGLIGKQPKYSDWADSIARTGMVSFVNCWYVICLRALAEWATWINDPRASELSEKAEVASSRFRQFFWDPSAKRIRNFETDDRLVMDANLLAIIHQLVKPDECEAILSTLRSSPLWHPIPGRVTHPAYPRNLKSWTTRTVGLGDYHDQLYWIWLAAHAGRAESAAGNVQQAQDILDQLAKLIVQWNGIHEVYELVAQVDSTSKSGGNRGVTDNSTPALRPVKRLFYRAEVPFTWSAGTYLEMYCELERQQARSIAENGSKVA